MKKTATIDYNHITSLYAAQVELGGIIVSYQTHRNVSQFHQELRDLLTQTWTASSEKTRDEIMQAVKNMSVI